MQFNPDEAFYNSEQEINVIKIQSQFRGTQVRKQMKSGDVFKDKLIEEEGVIFKDEVIFEDGTVYKG